MNANLHVCLWVPTHARSHTHTWDKTVEVTVHADTVPSTKAASFFKLIGTDLRRKWNASLHLEVLEGILVTSITNSFELNTQLLQQVPQRQQSTFTDSSNWVSQQPIPENDQFCIPKVSGSDSGRQGQFSYCTRVCLCVCVWSVSTRWCVLRPDRRCHDVWFSDLC